MAIPAPEIDLSRLFPGYTRAEGVVESGVQNVDVRLWSGGTYATLELDPDHLANALEQIRRVQRKAAA